MFAFARFAFLALPLLSAAQLSPTGPSPNVVFKQGAPCITTWTADTSGKWKNTFIELMTGDNQEMVHLTTVASNVDGTDPTKTSFSFPCPAVTPNAAIYFFQFTAQGQDPMWTTRFAISDPNGGTTPPSNPTQPDGSPIPWGHGQLLSTQGSPPPPTAPPGQIDGSITGSSAIGSASGASSTSSPVFIVSALSNSSTAESSTLLSTAAPASSTAFSQSGSPASNSGLSSALPSAPSSIVTVSATVPAAATASIGSSSSSSGAITTPLPAAPALVAAAILALVTLY